MELAVNGVVCNDEFSVNSVAFHRDGTATYTGSTLLDDEEDISVFGYEVVDNMKHYPMRLGSQGS